MSGKNILSIARQSTARGDNISNDVQKQSNSNYINNLPGVGFVTTSETIESAFTKSPSGLEMLKDPSFTDVVVLCLNRFARRALFLSQVMMVRGTSLRIHESSTGAVYTVVDELQENWPAELRMKIHEAYCASKEKSQMSKLHANARKRKNTNIDNYPIALLKRFKMLKNAHKHLFGKTRIGKFQQSMKKFSEKKKMKNLSNNVIKFLNTQETFGRLPTRLEKKMTFSCCGKQIYVSNEFYNTHSEDTVCCGDLVGVTCDTEDLHVPIPSSPLATQMGNLTLDENTPGPKDGGYLVEEILSDRRVKRGTKEVKEYLIKWVGWNAPTWESAKIMTEDITDMVMEYEFNL